MAFPGPTNPFWQWIVPSAAVLLLAVVLAALVLRAGPGRLSHRALAGILVLEAGLAFAYCFLGDAEIVAAQPWVYEISFPSSSSSSSERLFSTSGSSRRSRRRS